MEQRLRQLLLVEAERRNLRVAESFYAKLDSYVAANFQFSPSREQTIIQTYLGQAGLRIANLERKQIAEAEDVKAAIWLYHLPEQPDDPCIAAGNRALAEERRRSRNARGLLTENFSRFLDQI